jgi:hypothetical protein
VRSHKLCGLAASGAGGLEGRPQKFLPRLGPVHDEVEVERPLMRKLLIATGVCLLIVTVEVGWRVANGWNRHWLDCHRWHPVLGWSLREGWTGRWRWTGGYSRINPQGMRDDLPVGPKSPGEKGLLIIGDSVTFGAKVRTDHAYPHQLQRALFAEGRRWRVLNGGVTGYDSSQEADWLELFGLRLEPDVVAVQFHPNDLIPSKRMGGE